ncbi:MAG: ABC transporter ATP-binding protein [Candidatus Methanosuratincola sp.]|jgi:ABC-2 type transport system ATP-binding protein|nr:ATP-binding cassette domain-containing protein [Candidatus Methanosuratincola sp.]
MPNAVELSGITKRYGDLVAVDHVSFEVRGGEIFGFLGPNGAGKTTTIGMLTGIVTPTEGTAKIFGHDIQKEAKEAKRCIGIVWEESNVYPELTAWENLNFSGEIYHVSKRQREAKALELLDKFGLSARKNDKVRGFSKGMKRRVAISMALINSPRLLFLDEPTAGLDVQSSIVIREAIREENRRGTTVFLTTHNIEEANQMCDRIAIINRGKIVAIDRSESLKGTIRSAQSIQVSFGGAEIGEADLGKIPSVRRVLKEGDKFRLFTEDPPAALEGIWECARSHGIRILELNTLGPTLEDVFINLTGAAQEGRRA